MDPNTSGQMIYYCCVAESKRAFDSGFDIVLEYPTRNRKLTNVVTKLLEKISHQEHMRILTEQHYQFFYAVRGSRCVMCVASSQCKKRVAFNLIEQIHEGNPHKKTVLKTMLNETNTGSSDKILQAQTAVEDVKLKMINNIDKVLDRGNDLDGLIDSTNTMQHDARIFQRGSNKLKKKMLWRYMLLMGVFLGILCCVFTVVLVVLLIIFCKFLPFLNGCGVFSTGDDGAKSK